MSDDDKALVRRWLAEGDKDNPIINNTVKLIQTESNRLKQYLHALPQAALECPTPCERWSVGDMIAHLVWFAQTYGGMMARGLHGDLSAPDGFPDAGKLSGPESQELYAMGSIALRHALGAGLLPAFNERYDWLNEMLQRIGPEDWHKPCYHTSGLRSVESFLPTIIQELAVHEWDIRSSLGPAPPLSAESLPVLMAKLPLDKPPTNRRPWRTPFPTWYDPSRPVRYRFDVSGAGGAKLDIVVEGDTPRLKAAGEGPADLYVTGDTSTFVLMVYDRLSLDWAISTGNFTAEGALELVVGFDRWLAAQ
jgi:uncharacterized protein (TIGR03083 family)